MKIKDNFLPEVAFEKIFKLMTSSMFPWYYQISQTVDKKEKDKSYLSHLIYSNNMPQSNNYEDIMLPILFALDKPKSLISCRANLYINRNEVYKSNYHTDDCDEENKWNHKTALFYVTENNGYTEFKNGKKVESKKNRLCIFDASEEHRAVSQTDEDRRILININYIEK